MAVQERQERGVTYQCFSARMTVGLYNTLNDWAWEHRLSLAKACNILLDKALASEKGAAYVPEGGAAKHIT